MQYEFSFSGLIFGISLMVGLILIVKFHRKMRKTKADTDDLSIGTIDTADNHCKKCNEVIQGNFCSNCGCPRLLEKIDWWFILNLIFPSVLTC
ncbi:MAG: hypothetical protein FWG98_08325 [Candidatus Cloacimonetes bacterium]|nr:hypothetical protein [Candidatus Cloacimonadota bacterium]